MDRKNFYELTYIINPVLEDDKIKATVKKYQSLIEKNGAKIDQSDEWGNRELEYEIDNKKSGYFVNLYFEAPPDSILQLEKAMRIDDDIVRFLVLKYDSKMLTHYELKKKGEAPSIFDLDKEEEEA